MYHINYMSVFLDFDVFADYYIRTEVKRQTDNQTKSYLSDDLKLSVKSFFVFAEDLDIVVGKS